MKLTVQDLAMFIGCEYIGEWDGKTRKLDIGSIPTIVGSRVGDVKLILRPLSDMTDEEKKELCIVRDWPDYKTVMNNLYWKYSPEMFKFLISKHFDVFGWIEKGLAISKF
jgi:hypothetical protein